MYQGGAVTFRSRFPSAPSSITLSPIETSIGWSGNPSVTAATQDGFGYYASQSVAAAASAYWYGSYTAVA